MPGSVGAGGCNSPRPPDRAQLDAVPGVGRIGAQELIAEIGIEMGRFPSATHLVSWAKFAPTTKAAAGKTKSSATGKGNPWIGAAVGRRRWGPPGLRPNAAAAT